MKTTRQLNIMGLSIKAFVAELMATAVFVYIGTGAATTFSSIQGPGGYSLTRVPQEVGQPEQDVSYIAANLRINASWGITTALAFGLAITVLAYATAHLSGGQLNPAVTLGLGLVGALPVLQTVANIVAQIVGAILGSSFLYATIPNAANSPLGSNKIAPGVSWGNAFMGEIVMTAVLVSVVLETAVSKKSISKAQAPLAIGFAVFCSHAVLLPIDGCSINPARSLGPAIVSGTWPGTFWVFIVGPFLGSLVAVPFHLFFRSDFDTMKSKDPVSLSPTPSTPVDDLVGLPTPAKRGPGPANDGGSLPNVGSPKASDDVEVGRARPTVQHV